MEVVQVLHMNGGVGETSYAVNSLVQQKIISKAKPVTKEAILDFYTTHFTERLMCIADLGCSSGPNALLVASEIMNVIYERCVHLGRPSPEIQVFLNDLPSNDFNTVFKSLPEFYRNLNTEKGSKFGPCYIAGVAGSFYGRLFPTKSLHFVHSSTSLQFLSQVPPGLNSEAGTPLNKGKIYISETSPASVLDAYATQFQKDFSLFLNSRSEEIVPGGRMVLTLLGRRTSSSSKDISYYWYWELLAQALGDMVIEGHVDDEKLDSFNIPFYAPCPEELTTATQRQGSFIINHLEMFEIDGDEGDDDHSDDSVKEQYKCFNINKKSSRSKLVVKTIRAVVEPILQNHFGGEIIMDDVFGRFAEIVEDYLSRKRAKFTNLVISMTCKGGLVNADNKTDIWEYGLHQLKK